MIASLDFFGTGDNRVAVFDWTGLSTLNSPGCSQCGGIDFGGQLFTTQVTYQDEFLACPVTDYFLPGLTPAGLPYTFCSLAAQKAGPIPLGDNCVKFEGVPKAVGSCPEGGIATNGDGASNAFYAQGVIWTTAETVIVQNFQNTAPEVHVGATYWGVSVQNPDNSQGDQSSASEGVTFQVAQQGYVSAAHEDIEFPSVAATQQSILMSFTMSGNGGPTGADNGGFFPSSAYLLLTSNSQGNNVKIHVADLGQAPQDGFSEYQGYTVAFTTFGTRPRWGDYGTSVFDPTTGRFVFASEFIQHPNCDDATFAHTSLPPSPLDHTCGGTRAPAANWGSSVNSISP